MLTPSAALCFLKDASSSSNSMANRVMCGVTISMATSSFVQDTVATILMHPAALVAFVMIVGIELVHLGYVIPSHSYGTSNATNTHLGIHQIIFLYSHFSHLAGAIMNGHPTSQLGWIEVNQDRQATTKNRPWKCLRTGPLAFFI